jgi:leucyl aminopeptidase
VLGIEVPSSTAGLPEVRVLGVPAVVGPDGPVLLSGLPGTAAGVPLPAVLDVDSARRRGFGAKAGQTLVLRADGDGPMLVAVGLGSEDEPAGERWRRASAGFVRVAGEGGSAALCVPVVGRTPGEVAALGEAIAEGAALASYRFDDFRSRPGPAPLERLVLLASPQDAAGVLAQGVGRGERTARAVSAARDLINTPPSELPPRQLADRAVELLGESTGLRVAVWDEGRIAEERLGGLLGVTRGSAEPPRLVRVDYTPSDPVIVDGRTPHVVLVGKGITFDSGGLSLKTPDGMTTMKTDMSGAAIVLMTIAACADLGVRVRVSAIAPLAENMPGSRAIKPGDVLPIRNGATIEVLNTDAEGRLVLADGLVLATELEPDAIIDVATLTGAATVALGTSIAALFGNDDALVERLKRHGDEAGERLWPMPLAAEYADHIDSDVADMKNIGRASQAGAIVAALLLQRFVGTTSWAHLDIAGTGRSPESSGYLSKGGTAFGVRTLLGFLRSYGTDGDRTDPTA